MKKLVHVASATGVLVENVPETEDISGIYTITVNGKVHYLLFVDDIGQYARILSSGMNDPDVVYEIERSPVGEAILSARPDDYGIGVLTNYKKHVVDYIPAWANVYLTSKHVDEIYVL